MTSSTPAGITGPAHGDILVAKDPVQEKAFTLSVVPGPPQVRCATYEDAVSTASGWAIQGHVEIWFTRDGQVFTPVSLAGAPATTRKANEPRDTS